MHDQAAALRVAVGGEAGHGPALQRQTPFEPLSGQFQRARARSGNSLGLVHDDEPDDGLSTPDISQPLVAPGAH